MKKATTVISAMALGFIGAVVLNTAGFADSMAAPAHKACPMIARMCPDGIHTSSPRGPDCEFTPCPGEPGYKEDGTEPQPAPVPPPSGAQDLPPEQQAAPGGTDGSYDGEPMIDPGAFDNGDVPQQSMPVMPAPLQKTPQ
jgi:hypothetical protein